MSDQPLSPPSYAPSQAPAIEIPSYLRFHWALVLLVTIVVNLFIRGSWAAWLLAQAHWMRKVRGHSEAYTKALIALIILLAAWLVGLFTGSAAVYTAATNHTEINFGAILVLCLTSLVSLVGVILYLVAAFALRKELEAAPFGMKLSGPMTFFFHSIYFQYHLQKWGLPGELGGPPVVYAAPPVAYSAPPPPPPPQSPAQGM